MGISPRRAAQRQRKGEERLAIVLRQPSEPRRRVLQAGRRQLLRALREPGDDIDEALEHLQ